MKIAILTSGILPVPAVQGGAVENLIDFYLEYNDRHQIHDITVYSIWHRGVKKHEALKSRVNHYRFIKTTSLYARLKRWIFRHTLINGYYHYSIEYYLHECIRHIRRQHYDVILIENRPAYALKLRGETTAKLVYHLHNEKLTTKVHKAQAIYDAADGIIAVSEYIKGCVTAINTADRKTRTVYNGIDLKAFSCSATAIKRSELNLNNHDFVLIFSGRLNKEKGVLELIEAMTMLSNYPDIKLLIIGSSFFANVGSDDFFCATLKAKAAPLHNRIFFTGYIPYDQMPQYLRVADVAVIPSVWDDPFPTTVLEALAIGLPIVATRRGGIPEEVTEESAILLNTDDNFKTNLAQAILDLYQHPEKRAAMSKAALEHSKLFSKERYAKEFFKALEDGVR